MWFKTEETLPDEQVKSGLSYVIKDGIASQSMGILTGGAFLVAFAVKIGASNLVIGFLGANWALAPLLEFPSVFFF